MEEFNISLLILILDRAFTGSNIQPGSNNMTKSLGCIPFIPIIVAVATAPFLSVTGIMELGDHV